MNTLQGQHLKNIRLSAVMSTTEQVSTYVEDYGKAFVALSGDQDIYGHKEFKDGLDVGDYIQDVGHNTLAVGNQLTVGSYNFYYKGINVLNNGEAYIYLTDKQPRYPYPFVVYDNDLTSFKIMGNVVNADDTTTYKYLSAGSNLGPIWNCTLNPDPSHMTDSNHVWRADYNQLCIDLGDGYQSKTSEIQNCLTSYLNNAFTGENSVTAYLDGQSLVGQQITMVNGDKIAYLRCGTIVEVITNNILHVSLTQNVLSGATGLRTKGSAGFSDFDYDDASLVLIDLPTLSGPDNTSTYSSLNVGVLNKVARRGSMACGKQLTSEADFAIAFGRRGMAKDYATFLWAPCPSKSISTDQSYTFNIGLNTALSSAHKTDYAYDIRIIGSDNQRERLYKYVWGCISSDNDLKNEFKSWLGLN